MASEDLMSGDRGQGVDTAIVSSLLGYLATQMIQRPWQSLLAGTPSS